MESSPASPDAAGQESSHLPVVTKRATEPDPIDELEAEPARRRRRGLKVAGVCGLVLVAVGVTYLATRSTNPSTASTVQRSTTLVSVTKRNLVETASFDGTIGYANQRGVTAVAQSTGTGAAAVSSASVVTSVARVGTIVGRGQQLFAVNSQPTLLLYGSFPAYRALASGVTDGPDVKQLQANLVALGYASIVPSETWNSATTTGIDRWEAALGLTEDGKVPLGRVVFAPDRVRIAAAANVGDTVASGSSVVTISSTQRQATVSLAAADAASVSLNDPVQVTLPSGKTVTGRVSTVGTVATAASSGSGGGGTAQGGAVNQSGASSATSGATLDVTISLAGAKGLGSLATAPVSVAFAQQRARNVLAVPTTALLTLADGTFAVEVSRGGTSTQLVRVTPGLFAAGGFVSVKGAIKAGDKVVVPQ